MRMKPTGKTYDIDSFEQLVNVLNRDNAESLTMDFILWMGYLVQTFEDFRNKYPKESEGKTNWQLAQCHFIWKDDGKNEAKSVIIKNIQTGEITTVDLKEKK